ncbi:MAG TPA: hypothetical protein VG318_18255 [Actinomycetota bacterium]|nr:hypothetical protein [Actinomycetota bacterium]
MADNYEQREPAAGDFAFVICQIGPPGSDIRHRTDEVCDFVLREPLTERRLRLSRSDEDPTPGTVSEQIVRSIVNARVVIADLTGRNPNVYYELGIAHSFGKPLIILVDSTENLAFDIQGERVIPIGDDGLEIGARKAAAAAAEVRRQLDVVLAENYVPHSLVRAVSLTATLERFATDDPMKAQLVRLTELVEDLRNQRTEQAPVGGGRELTSVGDQVTPEHIAYLSTRNEISGADALTLLAQLTPQQLKMLSLLWKLHGDEVDSRQELARRLGITTPRLRAVFNRTKDIIGPAPRRGED